MTGLLQLAKCCKEGIYQHGRLLERLLYEYYFNELQQGQCLAALRAYQNYDGGFGNGIEPDILCPESSAIAVETALFYVDMADAHKGSIIEDIQYWTSHHIQPNGTIVHPPATYFDYPHQPWWDKPDKWRSLAIYGHLLRLKKLTVAEIPPAVKALASTFALEGKLEFYEYPYFLYTYALKGTNNSNYEYLLRHLNSFLTNNKNHYPLFSRYWYWLIPVLPQEVIQAELQAVVEAIERYNKVPNPYPELPIWDGLFTLDALMIIKKYNLIN